MIQSTEVSLKGCSLSLRKKGIGITVEIQERRRQVANAKSGTDARNFTLALSDNSESGEPSSAGRLRRSWRNYC